LSIEKKLLKPFAGFEVFFCRTFPALLSPISKLVSGSTIPEADSVIKDNENENLAKIIYCRPV